MGFHNTQTVTTLSTFNKVDSYALMTEVSRVVYYPDTTTDRSNFIEQTMLECYKYSNMTLLLNKCNIIHNFIF